MSFPRKLLSLLLVLLLLPAAALATSTGAVQNTRTGQTYQSLKDAVDGASTGDTLELLADVSLSAPLTINKSLTLNFGAYTVRPDSSFNQSILVTVKAPVTLKGTTGGIDITGGTTAKYCVDARSSLTIESGRYLSDAAVIQAVGAPSRAGSSAAASRHPPVPSSPSTPLPPMTPMSKASSPSGRMPAFTTAPMPASCSPVPI